MFDFLKPSHYTSSSSNNSSPLSFSLPTALILLDNQAAFAHPTSLHPDDTPGSSRSNPLFEVNLTSLLAAFRVARETSLSSSSGQDHDTSITSGNPHLEIIHVFHTSDSPASPLHPHHPGNGIRPLDFARPLPPESGEDGDPASAREGEKFLWKSVASEPIGPELESHLRNQGIQQILFAGLRTDDCVSATVRMAADRGIVEPGRIVLVADSTATWAKAGVDAETVHAGAVAALEGEFAQVMRTEDVVKALRRMK